MRLDVQFSESNQSFSDVQFSESDQVLQTSFKGVTVLGTGSGGTVFIPSVSEDGIISWENNGDLQNPEPVNIKGRPGQDGNDGYTPVKGKDYFDGKDGKDGKDGAAGYTPVKNVDYFDGKDGKDGSPGKDGEPGYTPVKGTDYWTESDKAEMVQDVIAALPVYGGEVADA
jgi:hypothetical protein